MSLMIQIQEEIPVAGDQFTDDIPMPLLYEDFSFDGEPRHIGETLAFSAKLPPSTPVVPASSPCKPRAASTSTAILGEFNPVATTTQEHTGSTCCAPVSSIDNVLMSSDYRQNVTHPGPQDIYPYTTSVCYRNTPLLPIFNYAPNPPARWTSASDIDNQLLSSESKAPLHEMKHETPLVPVCKPTASRTPLFNKMAPCLNTLPSVAQASLSARLRVVVRSITPCCTYRNGQKRRTMTNLERGMVL